MMEDDDATLTLNVGGHRYETTRQTLTKYPDSMLGALFSGNFKERHDSQGHTFIDRDGISFRYILNYLRSGRLVVPDSPAELEQLVIEVDFYQIPGLSEAVAALQKTQNRSTGQILEIFDFEETAYFYRFYSDPPKGIHQDIKNSGLVVSAARGVLLALPLPDKVRKDVLSSDLEYRSVNISANACSKLTIIHHLHNNGWQLLNTSFANSTDSDGSYMVQKYMWLLPHKAGDIQ